MADKDVVTACLLIIGNEILSGRTKDANLPFLAGRLNDIGVRLTEARVIPDVEATIVATVNECRARFDYVFTTGGIGPTHDDITAQCVAKAFGVPLERNPESLRRLQAHYRRTGLELNEARLRMANAPAGASLVDNPVSAAPGFRIENVIVMAGVPSIMQAMFDGIAHTLTGGKPLLSRSISCFIPEGMIAKRLSDLQARHPAIEMGSYPSYRHGRFGVSLVLRGTDEAELDAAAAALSDDVRELGGEPVLDET